MRIGQTRNHAVIFDVSINYSNQWLGGCERLEQAAQIIISEVGLDMGPWKTEKQFSSFLGLCRNNLITGGKSYAEGSAIFPSSARISFPINPTGLTFSMSSHSLGRIASAARNLSAFLIVLLSLVTLMAAPNCRDTASAQVIIIAGYDDLFLFIALTQRGRHL